MKLVSKENDGAPDKQGANDHFGLDQIGFKIRAGKLEVVNPRAHKEFTDFLFEGVERSDHLVTFTPPISQNKND